MWRAFFLSVGLFMAMLGGQCLGVQKFTLKYREQPVVTEGTALLDETKVTPGPQKVVVPPNWVPWSLMATGAIVCLYSFTIPRRWNG
ncbi:MAG: cupin domain-containing protein [Thermoguttaceae bacterium]